MGEAAAVNAAAGAGGSGGAARRKKRYVLVPLLVVLVVGGGIWGVLWYLEARHYETTDDAFLDGHIVQVTPRIAGHVIRVLVDDNQVVKAGDAVVELDSADLQTKAKEAEGNLNAAIARREEAKTNMDMVKKTAEADKQKADAAVLTAQAAVDTAKAGAEMAKAGQAQAEAQVGADKALADKAQLDLERYSKLLKTGDVTQQQVDASTAETTAAQAHLEVSRKAVLAAQALVVQAQAKVVEAQAKVVEAQGQVAEANVVGEREAVSAAQYATAKAQIQQFEAALEQAKLNVGYTTIHAAISGRVTRRSVEAGHFVVEGQALFALVPEEMYVTANFKETQLRYMKVGQEVEVRVDAYPDEVLKGVVDSFQQGSGARFSLLPPENATGNYVKVVQRVPVKIRLVERLDGRRDYAPGESVTPRVRVR